MTHLDLLGQIADFQPRLRPLIAYDDAVFQIPLKTEFTHQKLSKWTNYYSIWDLRNFDIF